MINWFPSIGIKSNHTKKHGILMIWFRFASCCAVVASDALVRTLNLSCIKHPRPYRLQWLNECGEVKDTKQMSIAYNRTVHSTTKFSPFEIVYEFTPLILMDLISLPDGEKCLDGNHKTRVVKTLYESATTN